MPVAPQTADGGVAYAQARRPERTSLYEVVRDNLETLHGAIADGALEVQAAEAREEKELEAYPRLRPPLSGLRAPSLSRDLRREPARRILL